jgi:eukaryotic-like serine/threonine-protein kinase
MLRSRFANFQFDELGRELRVKGRPVELESKPLDILLQLLLHAGEVVTKEELLESVWPDVTVVDGSLATAVSKLRKAMGDETTIDRKSLQLLAQFWGNSSG